ncbi:MAG: GNAT family N-acetyltransferase [Bdellovibrionales bacterium]
MIRSNLSLGDLENLKSYLKENEDSSQFLINNLNAFGPNFTEHPNSGNFKILVEKNQIKGVFCLTRRGNLLAQFDSFNFKIQEVLDSCEQENIPIKGFIGDWKSVHPIFEAFKEKNPGFDTLLKSKEFLFKINLKMKTSEFVHCRSVRHLLESDFEAWFNCHLSYNEELHLPNQLSKEQIREDYLLRTQNNGIWGYFDDNKLISTCGLNSNTSDVGQVNGVFTIKEFRRKGLSRSTMLHMLKDCRDDLNHRKSILFTGEKDLPAQKLYDSIGYERIGSFALIFL